MKSASANLGTFGGVFTPSVLTILGLILFLRIGYVVGNGGVMQALGILALAVAIATLTSVSLAAIATNRRVRGGGDYYLISRSLGVAYGGALGLVLFVAQAVSVGFYCVGFAEGVAGLAPASFEVPEAIVASAAAGVLLVLAYVGADLATRFQFVIMGILGAALASFFVGAAGHFDTPTLAANWQPDTATLGFWVLFAVFFPAVTGFTQGVSMSGDLRDPAKSLPTGTLLAVGVSTIVYLAVIVLMGGAFPADVLAADGSAMKKAASISWFVDGGILAATLSSALASFLGAPRILQALSADQIFPRLTFFAAGHGPTQNPRRAVLLTAVIAFITIAAGNLNAIAGLVSMFFLISYGLLNYATYVEATAASPSFRPRFRYFHRNASLAGVILCGLVMLALDPASGVVATLLIVAIYQYVDRTAIPARWRDSRRAYRFRRVQEGLKAISNEPAAPSDWLPQMLVFTAGLERRGRVLRFASWVAGGSGIVTAVSLLEGEGASEQARQRCTELEAELRAEIEENGLEIYPLAVAATDLRAAMATLVQSWGLGPVRSNMVLLNWLGDDAVKETSSAELWYGRMIASAVRLRQHVVVLDTDETAWVRLEEIDRTKRRIDVWWFDDESSRLSLLMAHLMTRVDDWEEVRLRLLVPSSPDSAERTQAGLAKRLEEYRIDAELEVVSDPELDHIVALCRDATVVFMPLRIEGMRLADAFGLGIEPVLSRLPIVALVAAAEDVRLTERETPAVSVEEQAEAAVPSDAEAPTDEPGAESEVAAAEEA